MNKKIEYENLGILERKIYEWISLIIRITFLAICTYALLHRPCHIISKILILILTYINFMGGIKEIKLNKIKLPFLKKNINRLKRFGLVSFFAVTKVLLWTGIINVLP